MIVSTLLVPRLVKTHINFVICIPIDSFCSSNCLHMDWLYILKTNIYKLGNNSRRKGKLTAYLSLYVQGYEAQNII
jgi:hypothetical protein